MGLQMLDAWGKPPTRFFTEILNWVGDYQECVAIRSTYRENNDPGMMLYQGRYCSGMHPSMGVTSGQAMLHLEPLQTRCLELRRMQALGNSCQ